jgi:hypothetical protein
VNSRTTIIRWLVTVAICTAAVAGIVLTVIGHRDLGRALIGLAVVVTVWLTLLLRRRDGEAGPDPKARPRPGPEAN